MKLLLKLLLLVATVAYLVYAFFHVNAEKSNSVCQNVTIEITDSVRAGFITRQEVQRILERSKLYPLGKKVAEVNGQQIEDRLMKTLSSARWYVISPEHRYILPCSSVCRLCV